MKMRTPSKKYFRGPLPHEYLPKKETVIIRRLFHFKFRQHQSLKGFPCVQFKRFGMFKRFEPKHVKTSFLKACLAIFMKNIQHEELKYQLTQRRS